MENVDKDRIKALSTIKAQIKLLKQSKEKTELYLKKNKIDNDSTVKLIEEAIEEEYNKAMAYLKATREEVDATEFTEVPDGDERKTNLRTDEIFINELREAEIALSQEQAKEKSDDELLLSEEDSIQTFTATPQVEEKKTTDITIEDKVFTVVVEESPITPKKTDTVLVSKPDDLSVYNEKTEPVIYSTFDFSTIPSHVMYDVIPLPSKGECYPHKKASVPVAYLTASDENLTTSPNLYRDGKLIDLILERKILDKDFDAKSLCVADKDAILLFLRSNAYGIILPTVVNDSLTNESYNVNVDLSKFKARDFKLKGDNNGEFDFITPVRGDKIKFAFMSYVEKAKILKEVDTNLDFQFNRKVKECADYIDKFIQKKYIENKLVNVASKKILEWANELPEVDDDNYISKELTLSMFYQIKEVNGNRDRDFIMKYVENMPALDAYKFRTYIYENEPLIDFTFEVTRPGRGGGKFRTFLNFDYLVFLTF